MRIAFISSMAGYPWGGSEILWSRAALRLREQGHEILASVQRWDGPRSAVEALRRNGIVVHSRGFSKPRLDRVVDRVCRSLNPQYQCESLLRIDRQALVSFRPDIVCVSHSGTSDGLPWMEFCHQQDIPCISVAQANAEWTWPDDALSERLAIAYLAARETFFVSNANLHLFETQIATKLPNGRVLWNPFQVPYNTNPSWPVDPTCVRLAFVGRLTQEKGQDLVLRVLSKPEWKARPLKIAFFGKGPIENTLSKLAVMLGVADKIEFHGQVDDIQAIWANHQALILTSRCEGLPLAIVEAMLSARAVLTTDVAGNSEVIENNVTGFVASAATVPLVAEMMERAWDRRDQWQVMGQKAAVEIRNRIPEDPSAEFAKLILQHANASVQHSLKSALANT